MLEWVGVVDNVELMVELSVLECVGVVLSVLECVGVVDRVFECVGVVDNVLEIVGVDDGVDDPPAAAALITNETAAPNDQVAANSGVVSPTSYPTPY